MLKNYAIYLDTRAHNLSIIPCNNNNNNNKKKKKKKKK